MHDMHNAGNDKLNAINQTFGETVRKTRERVGLTQGEFAERLEEKLGKAIGQSTITRLEKGVRPTPISEVYAISEVLGVPVDNLLPRTSLIDELAYPLAMMEQDRQSEWFSLGDRFKKAQKAYESILKARRDFDLVHDIHLGIRPPDLKELDTGIRSLVSETSHRDRDILEKLVKALDLPEQVYEDIRNQIFEFERSAHYYEKNLDFDQVYGWAAGYIAEAKFTALTESNDDAES